MNVSVKRRFWSSVQVVPTAGAFAVHLDDKPIRTPNGTAFLLPVRSLADAIAAEWDAVREEISPDALPHTKIANAAIDKISAQRDEVIAMLADYAGTDLLCHRADSPDALVARQSAAWDPPLTRARKKYGLSLTPVVGVLPTRQPAGTIAGYRAWLQPKDNFSLMALHDLVTISGSVVLAHSLDHGDMTPAAAWAASRIDEQWQTEQWGQDSIAMAAEAAKEREFLRAAAVLQMVKGGRHP